MNISELTIGQAREIAALFSAQPSTVHPYKIGQAYLIETVTKYFTGRLMAAHADELVITEAAWISDTGRYSQAVKSGDFSEVEPIDGPVIISRGSIVAVIEQPKLNLSQK
jgi:hypothetical protein